MDSVYREIKPSPHLASCIECFWTSDVLEQFAARVLPDGCADILFVARKNELIDVQVVGVMTGPHEVPLAAGTFLLGVRFQPGMAVHAWAATCQANDRTVSLVARLQGPRPIVSSAVSLATAPSKPRRRPSNAVSPPCRRSIAFNQPSRNSWAVGGRSTCPISPRWPP